MTSGLDFETNINRGIKYHIPGYNDTSFTIKLPEDHNYLLLLHSLINKIVLLRIKNSENKDNKIKSSLSEQSLIIKERNGIKELIFSIVIINTPPIS